MIGIIVAATLFLSPDGVSLDMLAGADVVIFGERHDNPAHHAFQTEAIEALSPKAVVFEMLSPAEAENLAQVPRTADAMTTATRGYIWPNIADYADILAASPAIVGAAMDRKQVREAFSNGAAAIFGEDSDEYGLDDPLPAAEKSARELLQFRSHCDAMPADMMGGMVQAQRLRDAVFARAVVKAVAKYGTPIVLITGNGHAREDWGVPSYLTRVAPDLQVLSVGQAEGGVRPDGSFSFVVDGPSVTRADPCAAFK